MFTRWVAPMLQSSIDDYILSPGPINLQAVAKSFGRSSKQTNEDPKGENPPDKSLLIQKCLLSYKLEALRYPLAGQPVRGNQEYSRSPILMQLPWRTVSTIASPRLDPSDRDYPAGGTHGGRKHSHRFKA